MNEFPKYTWKVVLVEMTVILVVFIALGQLGVNDFKTQFLIVCIVGIVMDTIRLKISKKNKE